MDVKTGREETTNPACFPQLLGYFTCSFQKKHNEGISRLNEREYGICSQWTTQKVGGQDLSTGG